MTATDILILAGKRPRPDTVLDQVRARLESENLQVSVDWREPLHTLATVRPGLLVHRGLTPAILTQLRTALANARTQTLVVNSLDGCLIALDRAGAMVRLHKAAVPVPQSSLQTDWAAVCRLTRQSAVYVKASSGLTGRGTGVVALSQGMATDPPFPGPWHVEAAVPSDGVDRKLYVVGSHVFGLLKPWPRDTHPVQPFEPSATMVDIALAAGQALGLELFGVDLVGCNDRYAVVDLNPFPGYRGVEGAAAAVADHIAARTNAL